MIEKQSRLKKTMVILLIGLFLTAGIIPSMNSNNIKAFSTDDSFITVDIAATVALSKIGELGKTNFYITDSLSIHNGQDLLCYIFDLRPMGYIVVTGSYDLPPDGKNDHCAPAAGELLISHRGERPPSPIKQA